MKERTEGREQPPVLGGAGGCADTSPLSLVPPCEGGELKVKRTLQESLLLWMFWVVRCHLQNWGVLDLCMDFRKTEQGQYRGQVRNTRGTGFLWLLVIGFGYKAERKIGL